MYIFPLMNTINSE